MSFQLEFSTSGQLDFASEVRRMDVMINTTNKTYLGLAGIISVLSLVLLSLFARVTEQNRAAFEAQELESTRSFLAIQEAENALKMAETQSTADKARNTELQSRLTQLQSTIGVVLGDLPPQTLTPCTDDDLLLTGYHLDQRIDTVFKQIDHHALVEAAGLSKEWIVTGVYHSSENLKDDFVIMSSVEIETFDQTTIFSQQLGQTARAYDFAAYLEGPQAVKCLQRIRMHFAESATGVEEAGWQIESAIGRSGLGIGRFSLPYGTKFHKGNLWTTDCSNENVSVFGLDGRFKGSFGRFGTQLGLMDTPAAMEIVGNYIYVVEERNHRIQKFDLNGTPIDVIGSHKSTDNPLLYTDKLDSPLGIAWNGRHLAVVDYGNNRILGMDPARNYETVWVSGNLSEDEPIQWHGPYYIRWSAKDNYFIVSNRSANELVIMGAEGEKLRSLARDDLNIPHELDINEDGDIFVADMRNYRVRILDAESNYSAAESTSIDFPESYGLPKTLTVLPGGRISVGFVGNGTAYFLVLSPTDSSLKDNEISSKINGEAELGPFFKSERSQRETLPVSQLTADLSSQALQVYSQHCSSCHENGDYGAPARGNIEAWDSFPREPNELLALAIEGKGAMIPRGGCVDCSDDLLKATIEFMLPATWGQTE